MSQPERPTRASPILQLGGIKGAHWIAAGLWVVAGVVRLVGPRPDWLAWACIGFAALTAVYYRSDEPSKIPDDAHDQPEAYRTMYGKQMRAGRGWQLALGLVFVLTGLAQLLIAVRAGWTR